MLYLIGLGLGDAKDITVKGLEVLRRCSRVYLEAYTSVLTVGKEALVGDLGSPLLEKLSTILFSYTKPKRMFRSACLKYIPCSLRI